MEEKQDLSDTGEITESYRDPILSFPTQAQTHDEFRRVCRRGFILHKDDDGTRKVRDGQVRGKSAIKARKRELRALREIQTDIAQNGA